MASDKTLPEIVLILGMTGVGKSTFIQAATGYDVGVGTELVSYTRDVQIYPVPDTKFFLIDTPGFDDSDPEFTNAAILHSIASCLADLHEGLLFDGKVVNLSGIIYMSAINDARMTGSGMGTMKMFRQLVGHENLEHCVLLTTKWKLTDLATAEARQTELMTLPKFWRTDLENGAILGKFEDSRASTLEILRLATAMGPFMPRMIREYIAENRQLLDTGAGQAVDEKLSARGTDHRQELAAIREELEAAKRTRDTQKTAQFQALQDKRTLELRKIRSSEALLRNTRDETQERLDRLEAAAAGQSQDYLQLEMDKSFHRRRRTRRWLSRFAAIGAGGAITILSHGVMAPVGMALIGMVEGMCQAEKGRDEASHPPSQQQIRAARHR